MTEQEILLNRKVEQLRADGVTGISFFCAKNSDGSNADYASGALKHLEAMDGKGYDMSKGLDL